MEWILSRSDVANGISTERAAIATLLSSGPVEPPMGSLGLIWLIRFVDNGLAGWRTIVAARTLQTSINGKFVA